MKRIRARSEWEALRARGKRDFVVRYGVLRRGLPMAAAVALLIEILLGGELPGALRTSAFWGRFALCLAVFSASGALTASATWNAYDRLFSRT